MSALPITSKLSLGDTIRHDKHGLGIVVKVEEYGEYPVEALFKDSPLLTMKVHVTVCMSLYGLEAGFEDRKFKIKIIKKYFN